MTYIEGFITAVPKANKDKYIAHAEEAAVLIKELGASRFVETWANDVPDGKVTDFRKAVQAKDDEDVLFSWFEYPDKATRDVANKKMMEDPRMADMSKEMPFDGKRMIYGGFDSIVETGGEAGGYVDGFVVPVPNANKESYRAMAEACAPIFQEYGATRIVEGWGDDVPEGKVTDYQRAVKAEKDENIVYSFIEWPDKKTRDEGWEKVMKDERMQPPEPQPFDGKRMFWGGFDPILDR